MPTCPNCGFRFDERMPIPNSVRRVLLERSDGRCEECGRRSSRTVRLHTHHLDGNPLNNILENLRVLCASCHGKAHRELNGKRRITTDPAIIEEIARRSRENFERDYKRRMRKPIPYR